MRKLSVRFPSDKMGRPKVLLSSWVEHNKVDGEKFREWTQKAKNMKSDPIYSRALQAAEKVEKATEQLAQVSMQLLGH